MEIFYQIVDELKKQNDFLIRENDYLKEKIISLEKRLLAYENAHTPPSLQKKKKKPPKSNSNSKIGAKKGHKKWTRKEPEVTDSIIHEEETCPFCNSSLGFPFDVKRKLHEEIPEPQPVKVTEHIICYYKCSCCNNQVISRKEDVPKDYFGKNIRAMVSLLKFEDRLPFRKVPISLKRNYNLNITPSGVLYLIEGVSKKLAPEYNKIIFNIKNSRILYIDETKYRLNATNWWLWSFVSKNETLYVFRKSRSKNVLEEILGNDFDGAIVCDGWVGYSSFSNNLQRCWAHLLRESKKLTQDYCEFVPFHNYIAKLFEKIQTYRREPPPLKDRIKLVENMKMEFSVILQQMFCKTAFKKFANKCFNALDYLFTCVINTDIEPTNNFAEQALRELIVQRKIMGGLKQEKGAKIMQTITSLITTWKKQNLNVFNTMRSLI